LGLKEAEGLRKFCLELSSNQPSPGGGTASAAAGAMASSLLIMVCGITRRSKKHEAHWTELESIQTALEGLRDGLVRLASDDAKAYDDVVEAMRHLKADSDRQASMAAENALKKATEVPTMTAERCQSVLEEAAKVARLGTKSARSDVASAIYLALAGAKGAMSNMRINLEGQRDRAFAESIKAKLASYDTRSTRLAENALAVLRG